MTDRKKYLAEYYKKNKKKMNEYTNKYHKKMKKKLGAKAYKEWKSIENAKYRERVK